MRHNMNSAYEREMRLMPVIMDMEANGIRLHPEILRIQAYWISKFVEAEKILSKAVTAEPGTKAWFNEARKKGIINESKIVYTDKGNPRYGREFLADLVDNDDIRNALVSRSKLQKALGTYINPWAKSAVENEGRFYPYFSQTRNLEDRGTSTGRMSSNFQQIPKEPSSDDVPNLRALVYPDAPDHVVIKRDFNGQELRVAAEYAEGSILDAYQQTPSLDVHNFVSDMIKDKAGRVLDRGPVKTMNFLKLYGGGAPLLAEKLGISVEQARSFFSAYDAALPEFKNLMRVIENQVRGGTLLRTWGGRLYDVERDRFGKGIYYKLGNLLIQGSSADMTKEAMVRYYNHPDRKGRLMMQVHDELVVSVKEDLVDKEMEILRWAMDDIPGWEVPLLSEGKKGPSFGEMVNYGN